MTLKKDDGYRGWEVIISEEPTGYHKGWPDNYRVIGRGDTPWEAFCTLKEEDIKEVRENDNLVIMIWHVE